VRQDASDLGMLRRKLAAMGRKFRNRYYIDRILYKGRRRRSDDNYKENEKAINTGAVLHVRILKLYYGRRGTKLISATIN
jgi:hypothetical protein